MFTTQKKLLCKFADGEREERTQQLLALMVERDQVDESRRDRAKGFRDRLKDLSKKIQGSVEVLRAGGEERDVECRVFFNQPVAGTKRTVRADTGEVVSDVAMTELELQENLFKPGELEGLYGKGPEADPPADSRPEAGA